MSKLRCQTELFMNELSENRLKDLISESKALIQPFQELVG